MLERGYTRAVRPRTLPAVGAVLASLAASSTAATVDPISCRAAVAHARRILAEIDASPDDFDDVPQTRSNLRATIAHEADCAGKPAAAVDRLYDAKRLLSSSEQGRLVLAALEKHSVGFRADDGLPSYVEAAYDPGRNVVLLRGADASRPPMRLAVSIGHEGWHAVQVLERGLGVSIEAEQEAHFTDMVMYHEMLLSGAPRLPDDDPVAQDYRAFMDFIGKGRVEEYLERIARRYASVRRMKADELAAGAPRWLRSVYRAAIQFYDWEPLRPYETLKQQQALINLNRWKGLYRAKKAHDDRRAWERRWVEGHRWEIQDRPAR